MAAPAIAAILRTYQGAKATYDVMKQLGSDATVILKKIAGNWLEVNDAAFKTARTMALGREQAQAYNKQLLSATKDLAAQFGVTAKELADFQKTYAESIGRNVTLSKQQLAHMSVMSKIAGEDAGRLVDEYDKVGVGIARATAYTGRLQERAKAIGVSPSKATKLMADNIKLAASYSFRNGVADIEKMSLRAASMRMDMNAIMNATEKFADIEGAISTSANIQMLGGSFAREFSNPMGAMYEAMADPAAFQERILRTIEGKGKYDAKTGAVEFDPVTMRMMRELANQLGMSAEQLNNTAMASVQNQKVDEELKAKGTYKNWDDKQLEAIRNLSRTNVDENGEHFVTVLEDGKEKEVRISELTEQQLAIATDNQLTQEGLWSDVQDIKTILERVHGRARETVSTKEQLEGVNEWWQTFKGNLFNGLFTGLSNGLNGLVAPMISTQYFSGGGNVKPLHAEFGAVVPGTSYIGDRVPAMLNSGEMVLNQGQQKGLFDLLKNIALTGAMAYGGNKIGRHFGIGGVGANMALSSLLSGGNMGIGGLLGTGAGSLIAGRMFGGSMPMAGMGRALTLMNPTVMMNGQTIMNGSIGDGSLVESLEDVADAASDATRNTRSFSMRLRDLSKRDTFLGRRAKNYFNLAARGRAFRRKSNIIRRAAGSKISGWYNGLKPVQKIKAYNDFIGKSYYDSSVGRYRTSGKFVGKTKIGNWATRGILRAKGFGRNLRGDLSLLKNTPQIAETAAKEASTVAKSTSAIANTASGATKAVSKVGSAGKILGSLGKAGKIFGKGIPILGNALAIGGAISDMSSAASQYDAQVDEIEKSTMSERDKARAKDRATKEKNASYGSSIGSAAGTAIGGALGTAFGPIGTIAGMWLGEKAGSFLGKGIGSLFGGNEEKKLDEKIEKQFSESSVDKAARLSNSENTKVLESIDKNVSKLVSKKLSIKLPLSPVIPSIQNIKAAFGIAKKGYGAFKKYIAPNIGKAADKALAVGKAVKDKAIVVGEKVSSIKKKGYEVAKSVVTAGIDKAKNRAMAVGSAVSSIKKKGYDAFKAAVSPLSANGSIAVPTNEKKVSQAKYMANSVVEGQKHGITPIEKLKSSLTIEPVSAKVSALPDNSKFLKVAPSKFESPSASVRGIGKTDINLNVSGTIKLEGNGKSVDFDLGKLLDTPEFKRQLADIVTRRLNENSNSGKRNMESERNNMASQYNKSGK